MERASRPSFALTPLEPRPVLRVPVMQENVWNPLKPQLCFFLSPVFHLMGLAGCQFCASELREVGEVQARLRPGQRAGVRREARPGVGARGSAQPSRWGLPDADVGGPVQGEARLPSLVQGGCWRSVRGCGPQPGFW